MNTASGGYFYRKNTIMATEFDIGSLNNPFNYDKQKAESEGLVNQYGNFLKSQETLPSMYSRLEGEYNLPQLRQTFQQGSEAYQDVLSTMANVPSMVKGTTQNSMVTESQRQGLVSKEMQKLQPLAESLGSTVEKVGQMLTANEQNLNTKIQFEVAQQKKELEPWEWKYDMNIVQQAREFSGWSQNQSLELQRLIANQQAGITISENEKNRMNELAMKEKDYQNALGVLEKESELAYGNTDLSVWW